MIRPHEEDELSHYSSGTSDVEYLFPIGWSELEGIANRGNFDLTQHQEHSGEKLEYFDQQSRRALPAARDRAGRRRRPCRPRLPGRLLHRRRGRGPQADRAPAPSRASPRSRLPCCRSSTRKACRNRRRRSTSPCAEAGIQTEYDSGGSIGKRYRRQDEIGTPWGITVDFDTKDDGHGHPA